jgi:PAS domain S-box-containing protein
VKGTLLRTYEGQIKIFLVLLVLFLAVAIYFNFHLLVVARNALQEEAGHRMAVEADLVRRDLESDQMLRGLSADPGDVPYIPPTFLDRIARLKALRSIEILNLDGRVLSSSDPARVGGADPLLRASGGGARLSLLAGGTLLAPGAPGRGGAGAIAAYRPIQDRRHVVLAFIRVEQEVPALAAVDLNLRTIAALQAGGLVFVLVLVILFARWLLQPYRRLAAAAGEAPGSIAAPGLEGQPGEPDFLVAAFQGVLDKLRAQEREVQRLTQERGAAQSPLRGDEDRLVRGMTSAVLVFDRDGRLATLNGPAESLLGLRRAEALGRDSGDLLAAHPRLGELVARSLRNGESHSREVVPILAPGGRAAHLGAMVSPIGGPADARAGGGAAEGVVCLLADLTEIKALRERVGLKENLAALGEMSAGIAHEFRNSLAAIQGFARLIARQGSNGVSGETQGDHAEAILREVGGVRKIVDDFLRYARPSALDLAEVDLGTLVRETVMEFQADPLARGIQVSVDGEFPRVLADETLVRQALMNLLRNSAESFTEQDASREAAGARSSPKERRIVVRGGPGGPDRSGARIEVEDNGPGVSREDLPKIFTPFFTTKGHGTGLGLALVQKTAVLHDGQVEAESEIGKGARFSLILPARPGGTAASGTLA